MGTFTRHSVVLYGNIYQTLGGIVWEHLPDTRWYCMGTLTRHSVVLYGNIYQTLGGIVWEHLQVLLNCEIDGLD